MSWQPPQQSGPHQSWGPGPQTPPAGPPPGQPQPPYAGGPQPTYRGPHDYAVGPHAFRHQFAPAPQPSNGRPVFQPVLKQRAKSVGAPLGVLIALGVIGGLVLILMTVAAPATMIVGFVLSTIVMAAVLGCYLWLDRYEPENPRLLVMAFLWGSVLGVIAALVLEGLLGMLGDLGLPPDFATTAIEAPLVEELCKGSFLLFMLTGRRRAHVTSLTDLLVYAGICAAGFAWFEDIGYIGLNESLGESLMTAALRLIMGPFAHPVFTSITALGIWLSWRQKSAAMRALCIIGGFLGAMLLHGLWNGSTFFFDGWGYLIVYVVVMLPIFIALVVTAIRNRRREIEFVARSLPGMVDAGILQPGDALWFRDQKARDELLRRAAATGGKKAKGPVRAFTGAVVQLAFLHHRLEQGFDTPAARKLELEAVQSVVDARQLLGGLERFGTPPPPLPGKHHGTPPVGQPGGFGSQPPPPGQGPIRPQQP